MQQEYTYAVARIRYRESRLLTDSDLSNLMASKDAATVVRLLKEKGWGDSSSDESIENLLKAEEVKLWSFIDEIVPDRSVFDFMLVPGDFHNLKVAVKAITRDIAPDDMFVPDCTFDSGKLYDALKRRDYDSLPEFLAPTAKEAMTTLLETSDGQLCDIIIDKACLVYVYNTGKDNENELVKLYCELYVACADIKIAVRSAKVGKSPEFIRRSLAECATLDVRRLAAAASMGYSDIIAYLNETEYKSAVDAISESMSAFEQWCDDFLTEAMKPQKWEPFSLGPIVAYIIARQNEIKAVQMILSAKVNDLSEDMIKERLRKMYV